MIVRMTTGNVRTRANAEEARMFPRVIFVKIIIGSVGLIGDRITAKVNSSQDSIQEMRKAAATADLASGTRRV